jgi:superfamily I DNA/RNA helicase
MHQCIITFSEMIWTAIKLKLPIVQHYKLMFIADEFNDFTELQLHLLLRMYHDALKIAAMCRRPCMQFCVFGEGCQSIYGFMGAITDPIARVCEVFAVSLQHRISGNKTHRLPQRIIEYITTFTAAHQEAFQDANGQLTVIEHASDREGLVREQVNVDELELPATVDLAITSERPQTVAALARNMKDVRIFWASRLVRGEDWAMTTSEFSSTAREVVHAQLDFFSRYQITTVRQMKLWLARNEHKSANKAYMHKVTSMTLDYACESGLDADAPADSPLRAYAYAIFAKRPSKQCGTIHYAKGLQWNIVLFLAKDTVPSSRALAMRATNPVIYASELHLIYVVMSRASDQLLIAETSDERNAREKREDGHCEGPASMTAAANRIGSVSLRTRHLSLPALPTHARPTSQHVAHSS